MPCLYLHRYACSRLPLALCCGYHPWWGAVHHMVYPWVPGSIRVVREVCPPMPRAPRLLDRVRQAIRARHYSRRTEKADVAWVRRYILFHDKRHPCEMGAVEMTQYLSSLAGHANVSASTQNQALSALLFLYREVLGQDLPWLDDIVRAKRTTRLPVVLSRDEVRAVLRQLRGTHRLMAILLYGAGLRLLECARLRVKDVHFARHQVIVRAGKGDKDRATPATGGGQQRPCHPHRGRQASTRRGPPAWRGLGRVAVGIGFSDTAPPPPRIRAAARGQGRGPPRRDLQARHVSYPPPRGWS